MRILVCGGRDFTDFSKFEEVMKHYVSSEITIIEGGARGADRMAQNWAKDHFMGLETFNAAWEKHGRKAGYIRNKQMMDEGKPDLVIAFPGGDGTRMMVNLALKYGIKVIKA